MHHYFLRCEPFVLVKSRDVFMAAISRRYDMALGRLADRRYFLGIVHDWIKSGFMRKKEASSYIQMVFIVCCLLLTAPNKGRKDNQCLTRYRWCPLSVYHDIVTCSQRKLKNFFFFSVDHHKQRRVQWKRWITVFKVNVTAKVKSFS